MPRWRDARALALRAAAGFDVLPTVGRDVALMPDHVVLTEGNALGVDTFLVRDGTIAVQTFAAKIDPR